MYASQPMVDPNDDERIYMLNTYGYFDDAGVGFTVPRNGGQSWLELAGGLPTVAANDLLVETSG